MTISVTIQGRTVKRDIPTRWAEVTFKQFLELDSCGEDYAKVLSLFTGIDDATIRKASITKLDSVLEMLGFLRTKIPTDLPESICGYKLPKDLGFETVGQYSDLKQDLNDSKDLTPTQRIEKYTLYCAIYACKAKYGEYDWQKAEEMRDEFLNAPVTEVLAVGNFTLLKLIALRNHTPVNYLQQRIPRMKLKRAFLAFRLRMAFIVHSCISKLKPHTERTSF